MGPWVAKEVRRAGTICRGAREERTRKASKPAKLPAPTIQQVYRSFQSVFRGFRSNFSCPLEMLMTCSFISTTNAFILVSWLSVF